MIKYSQYTSHESRCFLFKCYWRPFVPFVLGGTDTLCHDLRFTLKISHVKSGSEEGDHFVVIQVAATWPLAVASCLCCRRRRRRKWEARVRAENFTTSPAANIVNVGYGAQSRPASNFAAVCRTTTTRTNRAKARSLNAPGLECSQYRDTEHNTLYSEKCDARLVWVFLPFLRQIKYPVESSLRFVNFLRVVYLNYCEVISVAQFRTREIWWYLQVRSNDCCNLPQYSEINIFHVLLSILIREMWRTY